jgi:hypothetical protein
VARQGHRVWATRLIVCLLAAAGLVSASAYLIWNRIANESAIEPTSRPVTPEGTAAIAMDGIEPRPDAHALDPVLDFARTALRNHIENHNDYTAVLTKRELVAGKLVPESKMILKLKYGPPTTAGAERTVAVYLKTLDPKSQAGREVLWIQGKNDNKLTAHEAGMLGLISVDLKPESRLAMAGNRYPITEIGIEKLLGKLIERGELDRKLGPATVRTTENVSLGDRKCRLIEILHENQTATIENGTAEFEFYLAQIYIDIERLLPLKYASFSWPKSIGGKPELIEEYTYLDVQLNVGLGDADFDTKNPAYRF